MRVWALGALIVLHSITGSALALEAGAQTHRPVIAVASSFRTLWPSLMQVYVTETGHATPRVSFASSGLLSTQILHGAPFDLFVSADLATVERLQQAGRVQNTGVSIARGKISLVKRRRQEDASTISLQMLMDALENSSSTTLAMPNPRHAPYGVAAQQALNATGIWPLPQGVLLSAENASQSLQFALGGAATFAIVPSALVSSLPDTLLIHEIPSTLYEPVDHRAVLVQNPSEAAEIFMTWLQTQSAQDVLQQFGLSRAEP